MTTQIRLIALASLAITAILMLCIIATRVVYNNFHMSDMFLLTDLGWRWLNGLRAVVDYTNFFGGVTALPMTGFPVWATETSPEMKDTRPFDEEIDRSATRVTGITPRARRTLYPWGPSMCLPSLGFPVDQIAVVHLVFPVRDLIDHGPGGLAVGGRRVGLQVDLRRVEPVEPVFELALKDVGIAVPQPFDLHVIEVPLDRLAITCARAVIGEGRGQIARALMLDDPRDPVRRAVARPEHAVPDRNIGGARRSCQTAHLVVAAD